MHIITFFYKFVDMSTFAHYLFSVEQKNVTQGLRTLLSEEGGKYMASEKQVSNSLSNSVLKRIMRKSTEVDRGEKKSVPRKNERVKTVIQMFLSTQPADSPIQVMDVVERGGLCKAHPCLPDVFTAVYRVHALYRVLEVVTKNFHKSWYSIQRAGLTYILGCLLHSESFLICLKNRKTSC